jgi:hypothetical protein
MKTVNQKTARLWLLAIVLALVCLPRLSADPVKPAAKSAKPPPTTATSWETIPWHRMLAEIGRNVKTAQLDAGRWRGGGADSLPIFNQCWNNWQLIVPTGQRLAREALRDNSVENASRILSVDLSDTLVSTTEAAVQAQAQAPGDLADAIAELQRSCGQPLSSAQRTALRQQAAVVPRQVAAAAALLLHTSQYALIQRNRAFAKIAPPDQLQPFFDAAVAFANWGSAVPQAQLESVDQHALFLGALELQDAMRAARDMLRLRPSTREIFHFAWDTPLGKIALNGDENDTYPPGAYLLIIDTGGDDTYQAGGGTPDAAHPISLLLDMGGNDTFTAEHYAFGAGILGYGFMYKDGGNAHYAITSYGEACGVCGVGVLEDTGGQDDLMCNMLAQGAGIWGLGLLTQGPGSAKYSCYALAQGYGSSRGVGILAATGGDNFYEANDTDLVSPSPQDPKHNTNMAQGAGYGPRGANMAGGVGLLAEAGGHNHYSGGVFCQGCAYWYSLGFLVDLGGNSSFRGADYTQAGCAHYSVGSMINEGGHDSHTVVDDGQALGNGRDNSIAVFFAAQGNNTYNGPQVPTGWGNNQDAIGIHVDLGENNLYKTGPLAYADQSTASTLGLFYAGGAHNQYPVDPLAKPGSIWVRHAGDGTPGIAVGMAGPP